MSERDLEPVRWIASSLRDLKSFPTDVQRSVGFNLFRDLIRRRYEMARAHHDQSQ